MSQPTNCNNARKKAAKSRRRSEKMQLQIAAVSTPNFANVKDLKAVSEYT